MSSTFIHDLKNSAVAEVSNPPAGAVTSDVTTSATAVDCHLMEGPISLLIAAGATDFSSSDETYTFQLYESDTSGGTYTPVPGSTVNVTAANSVAVVTTAHRKKRYVKIYLTVGGTTPSIVYSGVVLGRKKLAGTGTGTTAT